MANPADQNAETGDVARTAGLEVISRKSDATGCSKGDIVHFDTNGLAVKGTTSGTIADGFGVALEDVAANGNGRFAVGNSYVYVTAGAAIVPNQLIAIDATAGRAGPNNEPAAAALNAIFSDTEAEAEIDLVRDYFGKTVGRYIGHQTEIVGDPTDAADNDIIIVRLGL